ncbi:MAG: hypothetical protein AAGL09_17965 [Pseudomonadota bacterium]
MIGTINRIVERVGVVAAFALTGCVTPSTDVTDTIGAENSLNISEPNLGLEHFEFGDRSSSAWVSDSFDGFKSRQFIGDMLHFEVEQTADEGGLDVGVSHLDFVPVSVSNAKSGLYVCSAYSTNLVGPGRWWAGPKISVNWQGEESAKQNGDDWYENYIVEIASSTPQALHDLFTGDYFKAEELPPLVLSGSTYRNYKIRFHDWWQFWSVRQDYRKKGTLPVEPILDAWIASGLPAERQFDGVKANIETYGPLSGTGWLTIATSSDPTNLNCDPAATD